MKLYWKNFVFYFKFRIIDYISGQYLQNTRKTGVKYGKKDASKVNIRPKNHKKPVDFEG